MKKCDKGQKKKSGWPKYLKIHFMLYFGMYKAEPVNASQLLRQSFYKIMLS